MRHPARWCKFSGTQAGSLGVSDRRETAAMEIATDSPSLPSIIQKEQLNMNEDFLGLVANIVASIGVVVCAVAGFSRLLGSYHVLGYEAMTLFIGGISLMVFAMLIKLHIVERRISGKR